MVSEQTEQTQSKRRTLGFYWPFGLSIGVYALDQFTKWLTETQLGPYGSGKEADFLGGLVRFRYVQNTGASFGFLKDAPWLFILLAIAAALGVIIWYVWDGTQDRVYQFVTGMVLAGIVGNLSDRLFKGGAVTDMINFPWFEFFRNFNVADSSITIGITTLLITVLWRSFFGEKDDKAKEEEKAKTE